MKRFLAYLLLMLPVCSFAQTNFKKGYVLTSPGDTLRGYINYKERMLNPSTVSFRTAPDSKTQVFNQDNCLGYGIDRIQSFERHIVNVSTGSINTATVKMGRDTSFVKDTVFLNVLQKGKNVNLYGYTDGLKTRFYLSERGNPQPYELERYVYLTPDISQTDIISTDKVYSRQLLKVMHKLDAGVVKGEKLIDKLQYTEADLIKLVSLINEQEQTKPKVSHMRFFAGIGLDQISGFYKGDNYLANAAAKSKVSYLPAVNLGIDILANPAIGKTVFRLGLSFFRSKNEISTVTNDVAFARVDHVYDEKAIMVSAQLIYNFYNTRALKVFAGAGFGGTIGFYSHNLTTRYNSVNQATLPTPYQVNFDGFSASVPITAGVVINRKVEISATYIPSTTIAHFDDFSVFRKHSEVGIKYLFGGR